MPTTTFPANPLVTPAHIVPEWYYLPFYAILRAIPDKLMGVLALVASIVILAFLPWLDTSRCARRATGRCYRQFFWVFVIVCIGLGWLGAKPAEGGYVIAARILDLLLLRALPAHPAAAWHLREDAKPLPNSITESVLREGIPSGASRRRRPRRIADERA